MKKGWGGEDDYFLITIVEKELCVLSTKTQFSKYLMIEHQLSTQNENRWDLLMSSTKRIDKDGLININKVS